MTALELYTEINSLAAPQTRINFFTIPSVSASASLLSSLVCFCQTLLTLQLYTKDICTNFKKLFHCKDQTAEHTTPSIVLQQLSETKE
jgi:hypothetical protein